MSEKKNTAAVIKDKIEMLKNTYPNLCTSNSPKIETAKTGIIKLLQIMLKVINAIAFRMSFARL